MVKICTNGFRLCRIFTQHEANANRKICYHCEQASEKLLKAVLVASNIEPPKTHDLIVLCKKCTELDPSFDSLAEACIELSPYGVQTRYPSNLDLSNTDMQCAISMCHLIDKFVRTKLKNKSSL